MTPPKTDAERYVAGRSATGALKLVPPSEPPRPMRFIGRAYSSPAEPELPKDVAAMAAGKKKRARTNHAPAVKARILERLKGGESVANIVAETGMSVATVNAWKRTAGLTKKKRAGKARKVARRSGPGVSMAASLESALAEIERAKQSILAFQEAARKVFGS